MPIRSLAFPTALSFAALALGQEPPKSAPADGSKPWRLHQVLGLPDWLRVSGEHRTRYETLAHQYRASTALGDYDDLFSLRTSVLAEARFEPVTARLEVLDARQYEADRTSFVNTSIVDALDVLQAAADFDLGSGGGATQRLRIGRETVDLGGRRLMARNQFANTITAFTGVDWLWAEGTARSLRAFWTMPVERLPAGLDQVLDNDIVLDRQSTDSQFYGLFADADVGGEQRAEVYWLDLDDHGKGTRHRRLHTPGARLFRKAAKSQIDWEIEGALQFGTTRTTTGPQLDQFAHFEHVALGYTVDCAWQPRVGVAYDHASGDHNPNDGDDGRFDTLFGDRRFEYGPVGIFGPVTRSNLSSPELRMSCKPSNDVALMVAGRGVWLADKHDALVTGGVVDASGAAGSHVGEQIEAMLRWWLVPESVQLEVGGAYLFAGGFLDNAPNARHTDTRYGYCQLVWKF